MDSAAHGKVVLAAIVTGPGSRKALDLALRHLTPEHFTDPVAGTLFGLAERYLDEAGGVLNRQVLDDLLRSKPPGTVLLYREYFDALEPHRPADGAAFRHSVNQLRELAAERLTGEAMAQSMEILTTGAQDGKRHLRGHEDARSWLMARFGEIERGLAMASSPEGDMRTEAGKLADDYDRRKVERAAGKSPGVATGIPELDLVLGGGYQPGELDLVAAYTSAGKTSISVQLAWHACVEQHRNVVFFTTETLRHQVQVKLLARHSRHPKFGLPDGLNSRDIKAGTLSPEQDLALKSVIADFGTADYGRMYIAQVPRGATVATLESRLARITRLWQADLVIIDYLQLLRAEGSRRELREDLVSIVKEAKQLAATYLDGRGVPVISPWQMNREGWKAAKERGFYTTADLAETAEAPATADVILSLLEPAEDTSAGRKVPLSLGVIKNRDGERLAGSDQSVTLLADYATSYFAAQAAQRPDEALLGLGD